VIAGPVSLGIEHGGPERLRGMASFSDVDCTAGGGSAGTASPLVGRPRRTGAMSKPRVSAGLLMYRRAGDGVQVLLVHPGGPFFRNKDEGCWSIPKGEVGPGEEPLDAAVREFEEEIGTAPTGPYLPLALGSVKQKGGKAVHAWAFEGDCDPTAITCNSFTIEWPPRSGRRVEFPEVDRAAFFGFAEARRKVNAAQVPLIDELERIVGAGVSERGS
jgi:predicted NUDIX family NTP pyrophosphohydrolase